jgi:hypothetical protein
MKEDISELYDLHASGLFGMIKKVVDDERSAEELLIRCFKNFTQKQEQNRNSKLRPSVQLINECRSALNSYIGQRTAVSVASLASEKYDQRTHRNSLTGS